MKALASAGGGFLLAVLWFDLMFDVQARSYASDVPEAALASIAAYYARVTTAARPMNRLVAAAMALTIAAVIAAARERSVAGVGGVGFARSGAVRRRAGGCPDRAERDATGDTQGLARDAERAGDSDPA